MQSRGDPDMQDVVVVFEQPEAALEPAAAADQTERFEELLRLAAEARETVLVDLAESGLEEEVELPETTAFNVLPARATPRAIEAIKASRVVQDVIAAPDGLRLDLLGTARPAMI